jgi:hypothetical protein
MLEKGKLGNKPNVEIDMLKLKKSFMCENPSNE